MTNSVSRQRVLDVAEGLFVERGYRAVTIKDIAKASGIHHASLYHHAPGGKEELFIEVTEMNLRCHQRGIQQAIEEGGTSLKAQLHYVAQWLLSQPPMDLIRMVRSDMPGINQIDVARLSTLAFHALLEPLNTILKDAQRRGEIEHANPANVAGAFFSSIEGLHMIPEQHLQTTRQAMADELIELFMRGMSPVKE